MTASVVQVGVDHRSLPLAALEKLHMALRRSGGAPTPQGRRGRVVALATCHRLELYVEGVSEERARALYAAWLGCDASPMGELVGSARVRRGRDAARHLLRVAAGLESAVLGEDQILGQVRTAYRTAAAKGGPGPLLHRLFHAAFRTGRRVRSETRLACGVRSLPAAAISLLGQRLGSLEGRRFLIVGAGEMASLMASRLRDRGAGDITVTSRTRSRGEELAARVDAAVLPWAWRTRQLSEMDGVACATGADEPVISADDLRLAMRTNNGPLVVVDLGVPRNVETPAESMPGLDVIDMATLARHLSDGATARAAAVVEAERVVAEELDAWWVWVLQREPHSSETYHVGRGLAAG